ncbi:sigma 54-interacting transcriptional regulator [Priestia aryabhattai]|uniref:sigma 54-interacting transcriptional regulator n=1 Tax=Priestia aryabhattai TaxID=412384 RepID=UPI002E1AB2E5|nr:sigma 54-interacting transcriptional regulator [Priestia aryabhattai]MED4020528.1 sigma 54-interacting transcriptional regulator [Priestia aryabhattai]
MKKKLVLITGSKQTRIILHNQLKELLGDYIFIECFAIDEELPRKIDGDVVLYSSESIYHEMKNRLDVQYAHEIVGNRTIHHKHINELLKIPAHTKVLIVNDDDKETLKLIESLYQVGINHVQFIPFKKQKTYYEGVEIAVSPGEVHLCPPYVKHVIDIGVRLFDMATIFELIKSFGFNQSNHSIIWDRYLRNIIVLQKKLIEAEGKMKELHLHVKSIVNVVEDGILAVDFNRKITLFNKRLESLFQLASSDAIDHEIQSVISNKGLVEFIISSDEKSQYFNINGYEMVIYKSMIEKSNTTVATFKSVNQAVEIEGKAQSELRKNGFSAKYNYQDIIGEHPALLKTIEISRKMAATEYPILIQGETGTGKELFAQAIHNHSTRKNGPFLAVNCSAMTDTLLESELFGYEEASFTGAQKGGKKGLFESADKGTIFLDEIGDISPRLQTQLLRVLQEKEIRRVGGTRVIPINVRIIAATHNNLLHKMKEGLFREDLYYRLHVLSLTIPPLRYRRTDIPLLIHHFMSKSKTWTHIHPEAMKLLIEHEWLGNIRELKGVIEYLLTVCDDNEVKAKDVEYRLSSQKEDHSLYEVENESVDLIELQENRALLETIKQCNDTGKAASRKWITQHLKGFTLTEQQVRNRLDLLEEKEYIIKRRGRAGTKITEKGLHYLYHLKTKQHLINP